MRKRNTAKSAKSPRRESVFNTLMRYAAAPYESQASDGSHERISEFNADLLQQSYFSEGLTQYALGYTDAADLDAELDFYCPEVQVGRRFEYATFGSDEEFLSDGDDDERPIRGDFPEVEYTSGKVNDKTVNRGLQITLDLDELDDIDDWEEYYTQKLLRRLKRNSLRRGVALLSAAAVNTAVTWNNTAGKDPDQDVILELVTAADISGIKPRKVGYGDTAWARRALSHRAQNSGGGIASAALTPEQLAGVLGVQKVMKSDARYTSSATAKTQLLGNKVLMFTADDQADLSDPSNIKRFWSNGSKREGGGRYQVYSYPLGTKKHVIAVGQYEALRITSMLGIRQFTVG